jgi:hypothetical protein
LRPIGKLILYFKPIKYANTIIFTQADLKSKWFKDKDSGVGASLEILYK